jgi:hypothetical protein
MHYPVIKKCCNTGKRCKFPKNIATRAYIDLIKNLNHVFPLFQTVGHFPETLEYRAFYWDFSVVYPRKTAQNAAFSLDAAGFGAVQQPMDHQ